MRASKRFAVLVSLVSIVSALALSAQAQDRDHHPGDPHRPGGPARPGPGRPGGPAGDRFAHGALPGRNFGGHAYHGHLAWGGGRWHHEIRNGRNGWWWDVGGAWYFYPQMIEGPPTYVSDVEYVDDSYAPDGQPADGGYPPPSGGYPAPAVAAYPPPAPPPPPPDAAVGGAVGGAVLGGILGGVLTGRPGGAIAGAVVGGTTGAIVGAQAASRPGYYLAQGGCYYRYPSGQYVSVDPRSCN
jgi:hypothetical protein